jgi:hypothetical protein
VSEPAPQAPGRTAPGRRTLLASAATLPLLLATAGCRSSDVFTGPDPLAGRPPLGHDVLTLQAVIAAEENLIGLYRTAIGTDHAAASRRRTLESLLGQHEQHLARLKAMLVIPPAATASPSPSHPAASPRPAPVSGCGRPSTPRRAAWCGSWRPRRPPWPSCSRASPLPTPPT